MSDRQYLSSLAIFAAVVVAAFIGIVSLAFWLGWGGTVGFLATLGGFLAWFYWGSRPDLRSRGGGDAHDRSGNE